MSQQSKNDQRPTPELDLSDGLDEPLQHLQPNMPSTSSMIDSNLQPSVLSSFPMFSSSDSDMEVTNRHFKFFFY